MNMASQIRLTTIGNPSILDEASDVKRLKELEDENRRLKQMLQISASITVSSKVFWTSG